jgi:ABC-type multidrug transport system ATPase subunit
VTTAVIRSAGLTKRYGPVLAVDGIDLDVHEGDVYGFLGANGSGKTTTVRMLLGLVLATSGSAEVLGRPMPRSGADVLDRVGTLVEGPAAYGHLSGRANLALFDAMGPRRGRRRRKDRVAEALDQVGLSGAADRKVRGYSLGMRQRLGLAGALLRSPQLLVLDEPTNGLDPQGIREIRDLLLGLNARGTTIFLSSHLLAEVEQMCTRVGVLDRGRLVVQDSLRTLRAPTGRTVVVTPDVDQVLGLLDGRVEHREGDRLLVRGDDPAGLNSLLVQHGVRVQELGPERRGLEQVVLEATTDPVGGPRREVRS